MLKRLTAHIPPETKLLKNVFLLNLVFHSGVRYIFYLYNLSSYTHNVSVSEKFKAFKAGVEFDITILCWITVIPVLLFFIAALKKYKKLNQVAFYIYLTFQIIYLFVGFANIPFFHQFGTHLNRTAFLWSDSPDFAVGVIFGDFWYWGFFIPFLLFAFILFFLSKHYFKKISQAQYIQNTKASTLNFIVLCALLAIGIRGRITDRSGLDEGIAIVSKNNFINQIAINPNYTFWKSILNARNQKEYNTPVNINEHLAFTRNYLNILSPFKPDIEREIKKSDTIKKYNFVIVIMESMSVFKMGYYGGSKLTPQLDKLNKESVFFNNFFSSGIHTFNGLFSTTSGYPSIYDEQGMRSYVKKPFNGIGNLLSEQGYESYFYTTHDPHFDNMQGFFTLNGFEHAISEYDFNSSEIASTLGVPDHILLDKVIEINGGRKNSRPFLSVIMTASDHGPWVIPNDIPFKPNGENAQDNCTLYADWSIGRFMEQAKKQSWYNNTVFIFLGDHGLSMGHTYEMPLSYNHVPCIIHQPKLFLPDTISSPCYQPDIPATVMGIIGENYTNNTFGINILKEQHPFVVFSADDKIGCVDSGGFYFYKTLNNNQTYLRKYKNLDQENYVTKMQARADSMNASMMHIYESAQYLIRKNYFLYP